MERLAAFAWAGLLLGCALLLAGLLSRGTPLVQGDNTPAQLVAELKDHLRNSSSVNAFDDDLFQAPGSDLGQYRYRLLPEPLANTDSDAWVQRGLTRLFTPGSNADPRRDPFGLLDAWLEQRFAGPLRLIEGLPAVNDTNGRWFVVSGQLEASPYDRTSAMPIPMPSYCAMVWYFTPLLGQTRPSGKFPPSAWVRYWVSAYCYGPRSGVGRCCLAYCCQWHAVSFLRCR